MNKRFWLILLTCLYALVSGLLWGGSMRIGFLPHIFPVMMFVVMGVSILVFFEIFKAILRVKIYIDIPGSFFLFGLMVLGSVAITNSLPCLYVALFLLLVSFLIEYSTPR